VDRLAEIREGDRFRTVTPIPTNALIQWLAPLTSSAACTIPAGTILVAVRDQKAGAVGFGCVPENYEELLPIVVPEQDRNAPKFGGYYFVLSKDDIGRLLTRLPRAKP
jgi:hypothetical protein